MPVDKRSPTTSNQSADAKESESRANKSAPIPSKPLILSGIPPRDKILEGIRSTLEDLEMPVLSGVRPEPGLATVIVGNRLDSATYVGMKRRIARSVGFKDIHHSLPLNVAEKDLLALIDTLNSDEEVDGILVQLPLPKHISEKKIIRAIDPSKDVDGFHPINQGEMTISYQDTLLAPCTPSGVMALLGYYNITTRGKRAVVIGRSNIVGKAMAIMLLQSGDKDPAEKNSAYFELDSDETPKKKSAGEAIKKPLVKLGGDSTVTVVHSNSHPDDVSIYTRQADIIVSAVGKPKLITADMVKQGATVVDVGINVSQCNGKRVITGDVDYENVSKVAGAITPVPGGVGPMTVAMLMRNTLLAYMDRYY